MGNKQSISDNCLVTVTTESFVPATLVMLHSFLKHNNWFKGDIVVIHDHLERVYQEYLEASFKNVKFLQVSEEIKNAIEPLLLLRPDFLDRKARFYALEVFRLRNYKKVFFYDSDILFRGSVQDLLLSKAALTCCGEGIYYVDRGREKNSLRDIENPRSNNEKHILSDTFSSGFLLIDQSLLTEKNYQGLLLLMNIDRWKAIKVRLTDQAVFLMYFAGQQVIADCRYNYLLRHRKFIEIKTGIRPEQAYVWHFNGAINPWLSGQIMSEALHNPNIIQAMREWNVAYAASLENLHIKMKLRAVSFST